MRYHRVDINGVDLHSENAVIYNPLVTTDVVNNSCVAVGFPDTPLLFRVIDGISAIHIMRMAKVPSLKGISISEDFDDLGFIDAKTDSAESVYSFLQEALTPVAIAYVLMRVEDGQLCSYLRIQHRSITKKRDWLESLGLTFAKVAESPCTFSDLQSILKQFIPAAYSYAQEMKGMTVREFLSFRHFDTTKHMETELFLRDFMRDKQEEFTLDSILMMPSDPVSLECVPFQCTPVVAVPELNYGRRSLHEIEFPSTEEARANMPRVNKQKLISQTFDGVLFMGMLIENVYLTDHYAYNNYAAHEPFRG